MTLTNMAGINASKTIVFKMRHKVFKAIAHIRDSIILNGKIQSGVKFIHMNIKGTKPENMPRISKKRYSRNKTPLTHKVCIMTAIDSNDQIFMEVTVLG